MYSTEAPLTAGRYLNEILRQGVLGYRSYGCFMLKPSLEWLECVSGSWRTLAFIVWTSPSFPTELNARASLGYRVSLHPLWACRTRDYPGANQCSHRGLGGDPQESVCHPSKTIPRYWRQFIQACGGHTHYWSRISVWIYSIFSIISNSSFSGLIVLDMDWSFFYY